MHHFSGSTNKGPVRANVNNKGEDESYPEGRVSRVGRSFRINPPNHNVGSMSSMPTAPSESLSGGSPTLNTELNCEPVWSLSIYDPHSFETNSMNQELRRLQELKIYGLRNIESESISNDFAELKRITSLTARIIGVKCSVLNLNDTERRLLVAPFGFKTDNADNESLPIWSHSVLRNHNISTKTNLMKQDNTTFFNQKDHPVIVICDASKDDRFSSNACVTGPPYVKFYAGTPLMTPEGYNLGTFCVFDSEPRPDGLTDSQRGSFIDFAALALKTLVARKIKLSNLKAMNVSQVLANISHDLVTQLTGIEISLSLLHDEINTMNSDLKTKLRAEKVNELDNAWHCSNLLLRIWQTLPVALGGNSPLQPSDNDMKSPLKRTDTVHLVASLQRIADVITSAGFHPPSPGTQKSSIDPVWRTNRDPMCKVHIKITVDPNIPRIIIADDLKLIRSAINLMNNAITRTLSTPSKDSTGNREILLRILHSTHYSQDTDRSDVGSDEDLEKDKDNVIEEEKSRPKLIFECQDSNEYKQLQVDRLLHQHLRSEEGRIESNLGWCSLFQLIKSMGGQCGHRKVSDTNLPGQKGDTASASDGVDGNIFWFSVPLLVPAKSNQQPTHPIPDNAEGELQEK